MKYFLKKQCGASSQFFRNNDEEKFGLEGVLIVSLQSAKKIGF